MNEQTPQNHSDKASYDRKVTRLHMAPPTSLNVTLQANRSENRWKCCRYPLAGVILAFALVMAGCRSESKSSDTESEVPQTPVERMLSAMEAENWETANRYAHIDRFTGRSDLLTYAAKTVAFCDRKREAAQLLVEAATQASIYLRRG